MAVDTTNKINAVKDTTKTQAEKEWQADDALAVKKHQSVLTQDRENGGLGSL